MNLRKRKIFRKSPTSEKKTGHPRTNLKVFLARNRISFEFLEKKATKHAVEASNATGIPLRSFAKTLIFVNERGVPFAVVLRADLQVNRHLLQQITGFRSAKTAAIDTAEKASGFPTGGVPPIGHRTKMQTFIDKGLLELKEVWCGGGSRSKLVKLQVKDIIRLSNGKVASFSVAEKKR
jgi:Cys-tRNA(Pro) deacylase